MSLYFVGLGLSKDDITVKGLSIVEKAGVVYLEEYTSQLIGMSLEDLSSAFGKTIISADREMVESKAEETILKDASEKETVFLVVGDPFSATTHADLRMRAKKLGISTHVVHNATILSAIGVTGLDLYKFGRVTTLPFENKDVTSVYDVVVKNLSNKFHTLVLLDLHPKQGEFMKFSTACQYLLDHGLSSEQLVVGCAQIGSDNPYIVSGKLSEIANDECDRYPQCLIVVSEMHFMEEDVLKSL